MASVSDRLKTWVGIGQRANLVKYSSFEVMAPAYALTDQETFIRDGHRKNALVYRCVEFIASAMGQPTLMAIAETDEGPEPLPPLDPLSRLVERPSSDYNSPTRFIKQVTRSLLLTGEAPLYKARGERTGAVVDLQLLKPNSVEVRRNADGTRTYMYRYDPSKPAIPLSDDEMIFLKFDDVLDRDRGLAPLSAAAREADVDNSAADYRKGFFDNGGVLAGILKTEQYISDDQAREYGKRWKTRDKSRIPVMGGDISYQEVGTAPEKVALSEVIGLSEARVCSAFGVEPILVGAKIGLDRSTYANYETALKAFWGGTAPALLNFLADELTVGLTELGDKRAISFDTSKVPAMQEDADKKAERLGKALERGAITVNEYREALQLDPVEGGDQVAAPSTEAPTDPEPDAEPPEEPADGVPEDQQAARMIDQRVKDYVDGMLERARHEHNGHAHNGHASVPTLTPQEVRLSPKLEAIKTRIGNAVMGVFRSVYDSVSAKLNDTLDPDEVFSPDDAGDMARDLEEATRDDIAEAMRASGEDAAEAVGAEFDAEAAGIDELASSTAARMGAAMSETTGDIIDDCIDRHDPDADLSVLRGELQDTIVNRDRADMAAATETVRSANEGARTAYRQAGVSRKTWRTTSDEPCEFCQALDGMTVGIDETFAARGETVEGIDGGVYEVSYADVHAGPLHPRCGCYIDYEE